MNFCGFDRTWNWASVLGIFVCTWDGIWEARLLGLDGYLGFKTGRTRKLYSELLVPSLKGCVILLSKYQYLYIFTQAFQLMINASWEST